MKCRHCSADLRLPLIDLGTAPPSNDYLTGAQLHSPEKWFPLRVLVCEECWLVQTEDFTDYQDLFRSDYAYFSSYSTSWLAHAKSYVDEVTSRFGLNSDSLVVEVAANDGYLLQYFQEKSIPCLGIEPTKSTATAAREKGIEIVEEFFGEKLARQLVGDGKTADLTAANNVLAHVPDINDFVRGFSLLLKPTGVATFEFPHLLKLIKETQFDTIYHEHFSYLSLTAVSKVFEANGLHVFDVEQLPTHGGSLRIFAQRLDSKQRETSERVHTLQALEDETGIAGRDLYSDFQQRSETIKNHFVEFLLGAKKAGKRVAAYGAAAKGNTFLNYAGIRPDLIEFVIDRNPEKQNKFLPGSRIPIFQEDHLKAERPDYVVILPWNLSAEIGKQLEYVRTWGAQFVIAVPDLKIF